MRYDSADRRFIWATVSSRFGSIDTWGGNRPKGCKGKWDEMLNDISTYLRNRGKIVSIKAINQQIEWGITRQVNIKHSHNATWVLNHAYAYEAGVIKYSDFPKNMMTSY